MTMHREAGVSFGEEQKERFLAHRMVVKIGGSTITKDGNPLDRDFMSDIARQVSELIRGGVFVVIVTSGAVPSGRAILKDRGLTDSILDDQVAAMVGQSRLMEEWNVAFRKWGIETTGQGLVTDNDLDNLKTTIFRAFEFGVVPIVNANDPVATFEMEQFKISADNDQLAGKVAKLMDADTILFLTDREGVVDENGETIPYVDRLEHIEEVITKEGSGRGGMWSKVQQAHGAAREGRFAVVADGRTPDVVLRVARRANVGTRFIAPFMIY